MTFIPYQPFDLDPFLKVTAAICILTLPNLNLGTNLLEAGNHNVSGVLLFASLGSTNMHGFRSLWPILRSQEVNISPIGLHVFQVFFQIFSFLHWVQTWFLAQLRAFSSAKLLKSVNVQRPSVSPSVCKQGTNCKYWRSMKIHLPGIRSMWSIYPILWAKVHFSNVFQWR